jgi:hypothetical protein
MRKIILILSALSFAVLASAQGIFVEAESFTDKGGWSVDQQFMDIMGSPYLIAHGMGVPVADASTTVEIPESGVYHVWVRSYNWTSPWTRAVGPGSLRVKIQGKPLKGIVGNAGDKWCWQYAGNTRLKTGACTLALSDMTGFDGRCDAVWLAKDVGNVPPADKGALEAFRRQVGALPVNPSDGGEYDFVVIGGGVAGMCAAVSAARFGCKVALVNDRPIAGGNNSSEIRVHLGGHIEMGPYPALGRMLREFGHSKGGNAQPASNYEDEKKEAFIRGQEGLTYLPYFRAVKVNMDGSRIASVVIRNIESGEELLLKAPMYADCTGDANLGYMAGADWMMGREGKDEYGEALAPEKGDKLTMGSSVQWYSVEDAKKTTFPEFEYGVKFTEENCEKVKMGEWTWETGMNRDQIWDFERIRDYGLLVVYSNWSFLKNHYSGKAEYANRSLGWVAYVAGKRESRRLMGDYILKQDDVDKQVFHEDASFTLSWHFDLHFPDPENTVNFPGNEFKAATKSNLIYPYAAPYRCLYSRNIDNLFMAGRDISTTHVTLGSTRLMRTGAMMGEVVGMAASICKDKGTTPRGVYQHYLPELKALMTKGAARTDIDLPDNQHFNEGGYLAKPKDIVFP